MTATILGVDTVTLLSIILSGALVALTAALVYFTSQYTKAAATQAEAIDRQVEVQTSPLVYVDIQLVEHTSRDLVALELFIKNVGLGNACNIAFSIDDEDNFVFLVGNVVHHFNEIRAKKIKRLAPGQRKTLEFIYLPENNPDRVGGAGEEINKRRTLTVTFENETGKLLSEHYVLDFPYIFDLIGKLEHIGYTPAIHPSYFT